MRSLWMEAPTEDLLEACRELAKHLRTQRDPRPPMSNEETARQITRTTAEQYREMAEEMDARDAAVERFRKALAAAPPLRGQQLEYPRLYRRIVIQP